jgi:hypothetical protein
MNEHRLPATKGSKYQICYYEGRMVLIVRKLRIRLRVRQLKDGSRVVDHAVQVGVLSLETSPRTSVCSTSISSPSSSSRNTQKIPATFDGARW